MREIILMIVVAGISVQALLSPTIGLYGYIWFALMRPDYLAWSDRPYSMALAVATLVGLLRYFSLVPRILTNPIVLLFLLLQVPIWLSVIFAVMPALAEYPYGIYRRVVLMSLLVPVLVYTEEQMKWLVVLMGASLGMLGSKYGLFGIFHGGVRFTDGPGGFLSDNNCFALALVMAVPLLWYGKRLMEQPIVRIVLTVMCLLTVATIIMTFSRGAAIALAATFLALLAQAKRKLATALLIVLSSGPAVYMVKDAYLERLATLQKPTEEASANSRIVYAKFALRVAEDYPWFGVGFGTYNQMLIQPKYMPHIGPRSSQVIHNTYLQMLTDSGVLAFALYLLLLFGTIIWLGRSAKRMRILDPKLAHVPMALQVSLIAYAVGSTFLSRVSFDLTYFLLMSAAAWAAIERQRFSRPEEDTEAAPTEILQLSER